MVRWAISSAVHLLGWKHASPKRRSQRGAGTSLWVGSVIRRCIVTAFPGEGLVLWIRRTFIVSSKLMLETLLWLLMRCYRGTQDDVVRCDRRLLLSLYCCISTWLWHSFKVSSDWLDCLNLWASVGPGEPWQSPLNPWRRRLKVQLLLAFLSLTKLKFIIYVLDELVGDVDRFYLEV